MIYSRTSTTALVLAVSSVLFIRSIDAFSVMDQSRMAIQQPFRRPQQVSACPSSTELRMGLRSDEEIEKQIGLSRQNHENRNELNELPTGKLRPSPEDKSEWKDDDGRTWKLNKEQNAAYHQPMPVWVAFVRAYLGKVLPFCKVPNLKFISPNANNGMYSEVCANRYTGELVIEQKIMGTFNFATDAPDAMKDGKLPTTGEHGCESP